MLTLLIALTALSACKEEARFKGPVSLELEGIIDVAPRPHAIMACPCDGDFVVLNTHLGSEAPSMRLDRFSKKGELLGTMIDFMAFNQGKYPRYLPRDLAQDAYRYLYVLCTPVTDTTGEGWTAASGFSILVFHADRGFIREMDFAERNEGLARLLTCHERTLYICYSPEILNIDIESGVLEEIAFPRDSAFVEDGAEGLLEHQFSDLEVNAGGQLLFSGPWYSHPDSSSCRIWALEKDFHGSTSFSSMDQQLVHASMIGSPGLAVHADGDVFLATFYGSGIQIFNKKMQPLLSHQLLSNGDSDPLPIDVATYRDRVYVADYANSQVRIYTASY